MRLTKASLLPNHSPTNRKCGVRCLAGRLCKSGSVIRLDCLGDLAPAGLLPDGIIRVSGALVVLAPVCGPGSVGYAAHAPMREQSGH